MATKTARKTTTRKTAKKAVRGKRYSEDEKKRIVEFVENFNMEKGRGGAAEAVRKFGVTALTISNWIKKGGAAPKAKTTAKNAGKRARGGDQRTSVLEEMIDLQRKIARERAELERLEARFEQRKGEL